MNKLLILSLFISAPLYAQEFVSPVSTGPVLTTETPKENERFNPRESHWLVSFGFEGLKYEVPSDFSGARESFQAKEQELWGGRIGVGGEIYLGAGFNTTTRVEGFYVGTLFTRRINAGPEDTDIDFAYTKRSGNVWGFEASQSIGFLFNFKTKNPFLDEWAFLTVEPFIEAGVGKAWAYNRLAYDYNTNTPPGVNEGYRQRVEDDLVSAKFGGGVNLTSSTGYFLYLKGFVNTFDIIERKTTTYTRPDQGVGTTVSETSKNAKIDPIVTYALGGGYKF